MAHSIRTIVLSMIVLFVPWGANTVGAQESTATIGVACGYIQNELLHIHYANVSATNNSDQNIEVSVYVMNAADEPEYVGRSAFIAPGDTWEQQINPSSRPTNGWLIVAETIDDDYLREVFYTQRYTEGPCTFGNTGLDPQPSPPAPTPTQTPDPTPTPAPNSFNLVSAQRMCADQQFQATWSGANIVSLEFALSNTSDEWTSGWIPVDPAAGTVTHAVDHHGYDKAVFRVVFEDDASDMIDADVGDCAEVPAPPPPAPPTSSGGSSQEVTSLPSTGSGLAPETMVTFGVLVLAVSALAVAGVVRREQP